MIIGVIAAGYLSYQQFTRSDSAYNETIEKLQSIEDALLSFVALNGRLPCPASPSDSQQINSFGWERINISSTPASCSTASNNIYTGFMNGDTIYLGSVPTRSLGLPDEYLFDGWSNRFGYAVQRSFINSASTANVVINGVTTTGVITHPSCAEGNLAQDIHIFSGKYFCFRGQASGSVDTTSAAMDIQVRNSYNSSNNIDSNTIDASAVYVVISYGENGLGAFRRTGVRNSMPSNNNDNEQANAGCNPSTNICNSTSVGTQFIDAPISTTFDDIIVYKSRNQLLSDCNNYFNNVCYTTHGIQFK
jgi:hypothetical protein